MGFNSAFKGLKDAVLFPCSVFVCLVTLLVSGLFSGVASRGRCCSAGRQCLL